MAYVGQSLLLRYVSVCVSFIMLPDGDISEFRSDILSSLSLRFDTLIKKDRERIGGVTKARTERPKKLDEADQEKLLAAIAKNPEITCKDMLAEVSHKVKLFFHEISFF